MSKLNRILGSVLAAVGILIGVYAFDFIHSKQHIDDFCNSINTSTKVSELRELAKRAGVDLRGPMIMSSPTGHGGNYVYAIAASGATVGEYACSIHATSMDGIVEKKHLGY